MVLAIFNSLIYACVALIQYLRAHCMSSRIRTFDPACPELVSLRLSLTAAAGRPLASSQYAAAVSAASARA
eukprot:15458012-Alexandrium_andersonii.AAC.1